MEAIRERISSRAYMRSYEEAMEKMRGVAGEFLKPLASFRSKSQARIFQAANYYRLPNPYAVPAWKVREDMKRLDALAAQCRYLKQHGITSIRQLEERREFLERQENFIREERRGLYRIDGGMDRETKEKCRRIQFLEGQLERNDISDSLWEQFADEKEELEASLPERVIDTGRGIQVKTAALKGLRRELKLIGSILETERQPAPEVLPAGKDMPDRGMPRIPT